MPPKIPLLFSLNASKTVGVVQKGHISVILAKAGIYKLLFFWIPAFAGMTTQPLFFNFLDTSILCKHCGQIPDFLPPLHWYKIRPGIPCFQHDVVSCDCLQIIELLPKHQEKSGGVQETQARIEV
ncbi:MAG: hypothetical protein ACE5HO_04970 [bacterium]